MQKTLLTLACLACFSTAAVANTQVTVYGTIDLGFSFLNQNNGTHQFTMEDSQQTMDRIGIKGVEDLGNGYKVGFILENGYNADNGSFADSKRLFNRESTLYVEGPFGKLGFGRIGEFRSGNGSWCLYGAAIAPFSTAWGRGVPGHRAVMAGGWGRLDNAVAYKTPSLNGFTLYAQYSGGMNGVDNPNENNTKADRYYSAAASYRYGPHYTVLIFDRQDTASYQKHNVHNPLTVSGAVTYDSSFGKLFFDAQYFDQARIGRNPIKTEGMSTTTSSGYVDGFGLNVGIKSPVWGGFVYSNAGFMNAKNTDNHEEKMKRWTIALGYQYYLSKETFLYGAVGYYQDHYKKDVENGRSSNFLLGMCHTF